MSPRCVQFTLCTLTVTRAAIALAISAQRARTGFMYRIDYKESGEFLF